MKVIPYDISYKKKVCHNKECNKIVNNILKLFNQTHKSNKFMILSIVADELSKKDLRKNGFKFSDTMYNTAKRKLNDSNIEGKTIYTPKCKKRKDDRTIDVIVDYLKKYSEISSRKFFNNNIYYLQESKLFIYKKLIEENPNLDISLSSFYKYCPKYFKKSKKMTDMCPICVHKKVLEGKKHNKEKYEKEIEFCNNHWILNQKQKEQYKNKIKELKTNECCIIMDFKEKFRIGGGIIETSHDYYNKSLVSCLGFCIIYKVANNITRTYIDYLSDIVNHDSNYVINCIKDLIPNLLNRFDTLHFWSDNAGHFRSGELYNYLMNIDKKVTMNYFVEYHGKSDVDSHFGYLQKAFNEYEKKTKITNIYELHYCFIEQFEKINTNAIFIINNDYRRNINTKKVKINQSKIYLSFLIDKKKIYGNVLSTFNADEYKLLDFNRCVVKETRSNKLNKKISKNSEWKISKRSLNIMSRRKELGPY